MSLSDRPANHTILITILGSLGALCTAETLVGCSSDSPGEQFTKGAGGGAPITVKVGGAGTAAGSGTDSADPSGAGGRSSISIGRDEGAGGSSASGSGGPSIPGELTAIVRDFRFYDARDATTNPDFENVPTTDEQGNRGRMLSEWPDTEIVTDTLGDDGTPAYLNASGTSWTTHGPDAFHAWFHDVEGTNLHVAYPIKLSNDGKGTYGFDSSVSGTALSRTNKNKMFFPIDDGTTYATEFGNQGREHNYSFTLELHTEFNYHGGEQFQFTGDDDVFVYIDKKLVINLGGIHSKQSKDVDIDTLGLTRGQKYPLDFFYAERHVTESNMKITTTLELVTVPTIQ